MVHANSGVTATEERERLAERLGVAESVGDDELTLSTLQAAVDSTVDESFASPIEAVRADLDGSLDVELLDSVLADLETQIDQLPAVRAAGIPDGDREPERLYRELVDPGWTMYDHLVDVGFFESLDANAPRFSEALITDTAQELVDAEPLTAELASVGFDDEELLRMVSNVVNSDRELARWVPTREIPYDVEFDVDFVPPLHQRASGGALLWIQTMDIHLWQKQVLITEQILDDGYQDIRALLAGLYLLTRAVREIAAGADSSLTDEQLMAALTAGAAVLIINQQELCQHAFYITEEMRAPPEAR